MGGHTGAVFSLDFLGRSRTVLVASRDDAVRWWHAVTRRCLVVYQHEKELLR